MSDTAKDGGPAFPFEYDVGEGLGRAPHTGMSLRDYFAAQAMVGLSVSWADTAVGRVNFTTAAESAYKAADAMLAERAKAEPPSTLTDLERAGAGGMK